MKISFFISYVNLDINYWSDKFLYWFKISGNKVHGGKLHLTICFLCIYCYFGTVKEWIEDVRTEKDVVKDLYWEDRTVWQRRNRSNRCKMAFSKNRTKHWNLGLITVGVCNKHILTSFNVSLSYTVTPTLLFSPSNQALN